MTKVSPWKIGLALGVIGAVYHAVWAVIVSVGAGQSYLDILLRAHFIEAMYVVRPFDLSTAGILVIGTGLIGFILGVFGAAIWNSFALRRLEGR
jgi:hypothetical protein